MVNKLAILISLYLYFIVSESMSKRKISNLYCDEVMPEEKAFDDDIQKKPGNEDDFQNGGGFIKDDFQNGRKKKDDIRNQAGYKDDIQRRCPRCKQLIVADCVMCSEVSRDWTSGDPDDRYTAFWNSPQAEKAITNAKSWDWKRYEYMNYIDY